MYKRKKFPNQEYIKRGYYVEMGDLYLRDPSEYRAFRHRIRHGSICYFLVKYHWDEYTRQQIAEKIGVYPDRVRKAMQKLRRRDGFIVEYTTLNKQFRKDAPKRGAMYRD